ncbi:helix-turn-helix domain-containing protein [Actinomadura logoneensis]|uniref:helix-turn-helix domain-containing protein n=1 Tax=Actinomadura logoneensis TaxID=2293572 RepID=UPI0038B2383D
MVERAATASRTVATPKQHAAATAPSRLHTIRPPYAPAEHRLNARAARCTPTLPVRTASPAGPAAPWPPSTIRPRTDGQQASHQRRDETGRPGRRESAPRAARACSPCRRPPPGPPQPTPPAHAAALGPTQPALSQQLRKLETTVGRPLLHRSPSGPDSASPPSCPPTSNPPWSATRHRLPARPAGRRARPRTAPQRGLPHPLALVPAEPASRLLRIRRPGHRLPLTHGPTHRAGDGRGAPGLGRGTAQGVLDA